MFGSRPIESTASTLVFRLHQLHFRIFVMYLAHNVLAFPLQTDATYITGRCRILHHAVQISHTVAVERTEIQIHFRMLLFKERTEIPADKVGH